MMECQGYGCKNKDTAHYRSINTYLCRSCADFLFSSKQDDKKSTSGQVAKSSILSLKGYRRELKTE